MIVDGKLIALEVREKLKKVIQSFPHPLVLDIVVVGENPVIESFVRIKKRIGSELGVAVLEHRFPDSITGEALKRAVSEIAQKSESSGLIIQLPLPDGMLVQPILDAVPQSKDVDMLSTESIAAFARGEVSILPPVAGAIEEILERTKVSARGKEALVLGHGRLVGVPASILLRHNGAHVTVIDKDIPDLKAHALESDIIISGVGKPGLITPLMVTSRTVLIDAGTSEAGGRIVGDADPLCGEVARVFTPVPGGVGPIAVVMIFKNLCILAREHIGASERQ